MKVTIKPQTGTQTPSPLTIGLSGLTISVHFETARESDGEGESERERKRLCVDSVYVRVCLCVCVCVRMSVCASTSFFSLEYEKATMNPHFFNRYSFLWSSYKFGIYSQHCVISLFLSVTAECDL